MNVALMGYRGCGKTTIGRRLADSLWRKFVDIDDLIVAQAGKSIKDIFEQDGEDHFRDLETSALQKALSLEDHVLGLGGGSVIRPENQRMLKESGCKIVYLCCDADEISRRLTADPHSVQNRPSLTNLAGGIEEIRLVLSQRQPIYEQLAHAQIDVTRMSPQDAVVHISRLL